MELIEKLALIVLVLCAIFGLILMCLFIEMKKDYDCVMIRNNDKIITKECEKYFR